MQYMHVSMDLQTVPRQKFRRLFVQSYKNSAKYRWNLANPIHRCCQKARYIREKRLMSLQNWMH